MFDIKWDLVDAGGVAIILTLAAWVVRVFIMRALNDFWDFKGGESLRDGMGVYKRRLDDLDAIVADLEYKNARLQSYCLKIMTYFSNCGGCKSRLDERADLAKEYQYMMFDLAQRKSQKDDTLNN